jgi:hypothetical protein
VTDATSTAAVTLSLGRDQVAAMANAVTGVFSGGGQEFVNPGINRVDLLDFATNTRTNFTNMAQGSRDTHGGSTTDRAFIFGGYSSSAVNSVQKYVYSTNTWSLPGTSMDSVNITRQQQHGNSVISVIFGGYNISSSLAVDIVRIFDYVTETISTPAWTLSVPKSHQLVTGNQTVVLSVGGQVNPGFVRTSQVETYVIATGVQTAAASLGLAHTQGDGAGDDSDGVVAGGDSTSGFYIQNERKFNYATETHAQLATQLYPSFRNVPGACHSLQID